ncbi:hypothetical protein EV426DRAFT_540488, partial [Tirmania nivea]
KFVTNGGGVPIRVKGVDGIVAVICVSEVKQDQEHGLAVQLLKEELEITSLNEGDKRLYSNGILSNSGWLWINVMLFVASVVWVTKLLFSCSTGSNRTKAFILPS